MCAFSLIFQKTFRFRLPISFEFVEFVEFVEFDDFVECLKLKCHITICKTDVADFAN